MYWWVLGFAGSGRGKWEWAIFEANKALPVRIPVNVMLYNEMSNEGMAHKL